MSEAGTFYIKRRDTSPSLVYALIPTTVDLTGATVRFSMKNQEGAVVINRAASTVVTPTVTPTVRYNWQASDTANAGFFFAEFEVTYSSGAIETFPNYSMIAIKISEDIA